MTQDKTWKRYLSPAARRPPTSEQLAARREHEVDLEVRRVRITNRIADLAAELALAREHDDRDRAERLRELQRAANVELRRLDEDG